MLPRIIFENFMFEIASEAVLRVNYGRNPKKALSEGNLHVKMQSTKSHKIAHAQEECNTELLDTKDSLRSF